MKPRDLERRAVLMFVLGNLLSCIAALVALTLLRRANAQRIIDIEAELVDIEADLADAKTAAWADCPDCNRSIRGRITGRSSTGEPCETCEGLARLTLQSFVAVLAGRMEPPTGNPDDRRAQVRRAYPDLPDALISDIASAWQNGGPDVTT